MLTFLTRVESREGLCPLLAGACQRVCQSNPLPGQQTGGSDVRVEGGVEDVIGGLSHHQTAAQQIEIIQRHQKAFTHTHTRVSSAHYTLQYSLSLICFCFCQVMCVCTGIAAEGHFSSGGVRFTQFKVPVFVDAHGGGIRVPAGVSEQQILITGQHLK